MCQLLGVDARYALVGLDEHGELAECLQDGTVFHRQRVNRVQQLRDSFVVTVGALVLPYDAITQVAWEDGFVRRQPVLQRLSYCMHLALLQVDRFASVECVVQLSVGYSIGWWRAEHCRLVGRTQLQVVDQLLAGLPVAAQLHVGGGAHGRHAR